MTWEYWWQGRQLYGNGFLATLFEATYAGWWEVTDE
jgi:hypothetical protein